ncbi:MAG TPA: hypothetical protein VFC19_48195 [Candidatus Limnocylindrales bacterium]|nr:hypothetical protein [Candidatus Limnocylindrales bacterium]
MTATIGVLGASVAACGQPATKSASANPAVQPSPTVSPEPRSTTCKKITDAGYKLWEPFMAVAAAGTETAKLKDATPKLIAAIDAFNTEAGKIGETADSELKAAISVIVSDMQRRQKDLTAAGTDAAKVQSVINSDSYNTGEQQLDTLCAG